MKIQIGPGYGVQAVNVLLLQKITLFAMSWMNEQNDKCHAFIFFSSEKSVKKRIHPFIFNSVLTWILFWDMQKVHPPCVSGTHFSKSPQLKALGFLPHGYVDLCPGAQVYSPCTVYKHPVGNKHWSEGSHQMQPLTEPVWDEAMNLGLSLHPWNNVLLLENWLRSLFASRFPCWTNECRK